VKTLATALAFLIGMIQATGPAAAQATRPARVFGPAIAEIQDKVQVPLLLPSKLPAVLRRRDISVARGTVSDGGYRIELRYKGVDGSAGFAALFTGSKSVGDVPNEIPETRRRRLANGTQAAFAPVSCGGSCGPANLWWAEKGVMYWIQIKLPSDTEEREQEKLLLTTANAMVRVPSAKRSGTRQ